MPAPETEKPKWSMVIPPSALNEQSPPRLTVSCPVPLPLVDTQGLEYGSEQARKLVNQARQYDIMYVGRAKQDRDRAVALYEQAIEAQPEAKSNAIFAERIAALYSYNSVADEPDPAKSSQWWSRCAEIAGPTQVLWARAQIGLVDEAIIQRDLDLAMNACDALLSADPRNVELWNYTIQPDENTPEMRAMIDQEKKVLRLEFASLQTRAEKMKGNLERHKHLADAQSALRSQQGFLGGWRSIRFWMVVGSATLLFLLLVIGRYRLVIRNKG